MNPVRILHIRSSYFYGGPERQITYLTEALAARGIESAVATFAPRQDMARNQYLSQLENLGIKAYRLDIDSSFDRTPLTTLRRIIEEGRYNILVGHDYRADYCALKAAQNLNIPAISFSRGWTKNTLKVKFYEWLDIRFLRKMDGVVAVSESKFRELTRRGIKSDGLVYIPNSIPTGNTGPRQNHIRDRFGIPHEAFLIGTAGRLSIEKRQDILIKAMIEVLDREPDAPVYCLLAGEGPRREELTGHIPDKYRDKIILAGWIDNNDELYADLDLFVLTSATEGFPNVLLEAGKYGLPAISTPAGGAVEIIEDGKSGILFPFGDHKALGKAISSLYRNPDRRQELGANLARITREKFDSAHNADKFFKFIQTVRERHDAD